MQERHSIISMTVFVSLDFFMEKREF